jgi:transcription initiation factor TFIID TATA-box-binding protein
MDLQIVNMVAIVKLSSPLNLEKLAAALEGSEFCTSGGKWLKMRLLPENYYIAFYKSGKFLVTGVKSLEEIESVADRVISMLKDARMDLDKEKITVHNVVMMGIINMRASLEKIIFALDTSKASYEPEQFPGLMYKDFGASFLLFPSGKLIVTGLKQQGAGEEAADKFRRIIEEVQ